MELLTITRIIAATGIALGLLGILLRLKEIMNRPFRQDLARDRGDLRKGILFAFTLGMAPWEKESTRIHWVSYLRGIFFHVGSQCTLASTWAKAIEKSWSVWQRAAERVGEVVSVHIIPRPHANVDEALPLGGKGE